MITDRRKQVMNLPKDYSEVSDDLLDVCVHPAEAGGLSSLVAVVGLGHGVGDVLDDGEVGADLPLGLALELAPGEVVGEPGGCGPCELDGQAEEGGDEGRLGCKGGVREAGGGGGVPGPEREPACWSHW